MCMFVQTAPAAAAANASGPPSTSRRASKDGGVGGIAQTLSRGVFSRVGSLLGTGGGAASKKVSNVDLFFFFLFFFFFLKTRSVLL